MFQLRPARTDDLDFVTEAHARALGDYLEQGLGWGRLEQDRFVRRWFRPERTQIVLASGLRAREGLDAKGLNAEALNAGLLAVDVLPDRIFLDTLLLLPQYQGQGIGRDLVRGVMDEAGRRKLPVFLLVLKTNPARFFYEKLGFRVLGEDRTHLHMQFI